MIPTTTVCILVELEEKELCFLVMGSREEDRHSHDLVPLAQLINRELRNEKMEKPAVRYGSAAQSRKGEDYFLMKTDCQRVPGNPLTSFSVFGVCDPFIRFSLNNADCFLSPALVLMSEISLRFGMLKISIAS